MAKAPAPKRGKNKDNARRSKKKISVLNSEGIDYNLIPEHLRR